MKPYEFMRIYNPRMGKFVYRHKGSGIIIDNIFKPLKKVAATMTKSVMKPLAKKSFEIWNRTYRKENRRKKW